jgi:hypothetical protein
MQYFRGNGVFKNNYEVKLGLLNQLNSKRLDGIYRSELNQTGNHSEK